MTTIRDALLSATQTLAAATDLRSARLDARLLLQHVLSVERSVLYAYPERDLNVEQEAAYRALLARRLQHEPVAYLLGQQEFYGLDFLVDQRVLIPRPETELLVEAALTAIKQRIAVGRTPLVADIGTGSGAIPVSIAVEEPRLPLLYACDISSAALDVARANAQRHQVAERIQFLQGDLLAPLPEPVDLLLANLPYIGTDELPDIEPDVHAYEPHLALFSGPDGLGLLRRMCIEVKEFGTLKQGGMMLLEIGYQQCRPVTQLFNQYLPQATVLCQKDYAGWDRLLQVTL